jgi:hypothetical protein
MSIATIFFREKKEVMNCGTCMVSTTKKNSVQPIHSAVASDGTYFKKIIIMYCLGTVPT